MNDFAHGPATIKIGGDLEVVRLGFGAMQGYLMCRPMPVERLRQEVAQPAARAAGSPLATAI